MQQYIEIDFVTLTHDSVLYKWYRVMEERERDRAREGALNILNFCY